MKNFISTMIITAALIALVSYFDYRPTERANGGGYGMRREGNSGPVIPGGGELVAEVSALPKPPAKPADSEPAEKTEPGETSSAISSTETQGAAEGMAEEITEETTEKITDAIKEEQSKVNGMIIAFWHGVAAVLIGEASALLVAFVWMKIRGGTNG